MASFTKLPAELRLAIWELCVPDPFEPEFYFFDAAVDFDSAQFNGAEDRPADRPVRLLVPTVLPSLMHVCAESRALCKKVFFREDDTTAPELVDVRIPPGERISDGGGHQPKMVPLRDYQPASDIFFIPSGPALEDLGNVIQQYLNDAGDNEADDDNTNGDAPANGTATQTPFFKQITRLAISASCLYQTWDEFRPYMLRMQSLRRIDILFGRVWDDDRKRGGVRNFRRLGIEDWPYEVGHMIYGIPETEVEIDPMMHDLHNDVVVEELPVGLDMADGPWDEENAELLVEFHAGRMVLRPRRV